MSNFTSITGIASKQAGERIQDSLPFSSLIPSLSFALDLTEGQPMGHVLRSCLIGMRIGEMIRLPEAMQANLYYALLLKDIGCNSNFSRTSEIIGPSRLRSKVAALREWVSVELEEFQSSTEKESSGWRSQNGIRRTLDKTESYCFSFDEASRRRCERGARISRDLGLPREVTEAIYEVDERWDGTGNPNGLRGEEISLLSRIISLAQTLDIAATRYGRATAIDIVSRRCGTWFDTGLVTMANLLHGRHDLWEDLESPGLLSLVISLEPSHQIQASDQLAVDDICFAFAEVVDAKSPFTFTHSTGVAKIAVSIAEMMGQDPRSSKLLQRAGHLHDIGKLSVPNFILEKPGSLTSKEWGYIRQHPRYTKEILYKIPGFEETAEIAAAHHEKLDGSGYPHGLHSSELPLSARILTVADIYDALCSSRPYRKQLGCEEVLSFMRRDSPHALDASCLDALTAVVKLDSHASSDTSCRIT